MLLKNKKVGYANLTGEGHLNKKKKQDENPYEYALSVEFTKAEQKDFIEEVTKVWEENKPVGAKDPEYPISKMFHKDDETGVVSVWFAVKTDRIDEEEFYKRAVGSDFEFKHFQKLGAGSIVDLGISVWCWNNDFGSGISCTLGSVCLNEFKKFTGGTASSGGEGISRPIEQPKEEKEKKKKKKGKKKDK